MSVTACVTYERRVEKPRVAWASEDSDARATYGSRLRILRWHADVVSSSSFRVSLRIFEQKRDCSQSISRTGATSQLPLHLVFICAQRKDIWREGCSSTLLTHLPQTWLNMSISHTCIPKYTNLGSEEETKWSVHLIHLEWREFLPCHNGGNQ